MSKRNLVFLILLLCTFSFSKAKLSFCNRTLEVVSVAIGYKENGNWIAEGWWNVHPGECATIIGSNLKNRYYYYRASGGDLSWEGDYSFCTNNQEFTLIDDSNCRYGGSKKSYLQIDTSDKLSWTQHLTNSTDGRDAELRGFILGSWSMNAREEGVYVNATTTYKENGRWTLSGTVQANGSTVPIIASGTWSIVNGYITEKVLSSNMSEALPYGYTETERIVSISFSEMVRITGEGKRYSVDWVKP